MTFYCCHQNEEIIKTFFLHSWLLLSSAISGLLLPPKNQREIILKFACCCSTKLPYWTVRNFHRAAPPKFVDCCYKISGLLLCCYHCSSKICLSKTTKISSELPQKFFTFQNEFWWVIYTGFSTIKFWSRLVYAFIYFYLLNLDWLSWLVWEKKLFIRL